MWYLFYRKNITIKKGKFLLVHRNYLFIFLELLYVVTHFRASYKQKFKRQRETRKYKKKSKSDGRKTKNIYIYQLRRTYRNSQKIAKDWLRKVKIYKIWKFDPVDKKNSIFKEENSKLYV